LIELVAVMTMTGLKNYGFGLQYDTQLKRLIIGSKFRNYLNTTNASNCTDIYFFHAVKHLMPVLALTFLVFLQIKRKIWIVSEHLLFG